MVLIIALLSSCYAIKAYRFRKFNLKDLHKFRAATIQKSNRPFHFFHSNHRSFSLKSFLDSNLQNSHSYGFMVIRNDSILYEKYFDDLDESNILPSFSAAKSFVGTLAQIAHQEGAIKSFSDPVTAYIPWLQKSDKLWKNVSIQNVLDMRTGVKSDETYNSPFSNVIQLGFTKNIESQLKKLKIELPPGSFAYKSVNTQILAAVIEAATQTKLQSYLEQKLWKPLGMESDATWQIDKKSTVRAFCCLNATMRDYAKLGRLYLNNGNWNGVQVLDKRWVQTIFNSDTMQKYEGYKNQWWSSRIIKRFDDSTEASKFVAEQHSDWYAGKIFRNGKIVYSAYRNLPAIFAQGMLGQYIYIDPKKNLIIVRTGHNWSHPKFYAQKFIEVVADNIQ